MTRRLSDTLVTNTLFNSVARFWQVLVSFFLTPYIIHHIGIELFGVWALIGVLIGYMGLLDLGVGTSFVKYISEYFSLKKYENINQVVRAGLVIYISSAPIVIFIAVFLFHPLFTLLHFPVGHYREAKFVFFVGMVAFFLRNIFSVYAAVLSGLQRMDVLNKVFMAVSIPRIVGTIFVLEHGYGISGLMLNEMMVIVLSGLMHMYLAYKTLPALAVFRRKSFGWNIIRRLYAFGLRIHISNLASLVNLHLDKILIAFFVNSSFVGFYELGARLGLMARSFPSLIVSAVMPAVSELNARDEQQKIYSLYVFATKCVVLVGAPLMFFVVLTAPQCILLWMGPGYEHAVPVVRLLAIAYFTVIPTGAISTTVQGIDRPGYQMKAAVFVLIFNILLSTILVINFGFLGAPLGTAVASALSLGYYTHLIHRHFHRSSSRFALEIYGKPLLISVVLCLVFRLAEWAFPFAGLEGSRAGVLTVLVVEAGLYFGLYTIIVLISNYLHASERGLFRIQVERLISSYRKA